jgi:hypothetical protein
MVAQMQNPGLTPRVSRIQLGGWLHLPHTASDQRAQMLASRFRLSPWMAQDVARLCFEEVCEHD